MGMAQWSTLVPPNVKGVGFESLQEREMKLRGTIEGLEGHGRPKLTLIDSFVQRTFLAKNLHSWANFHSVKCPKDNVAIWSHWMLRTCLRAVQ